MLQAIRASKGCKSVSSTPLHRIDDEFLFYTCIGNFYSASVAGLLPAFSAYEKGVMPYAGGSLDQPNKVIEAFEYMASLKAKYQERAAQAQALRNKARGRKR